MSGYMVKAYFGGMNQFYMVNSDDPDRACEEVLRCTVGEGAQALAPLSDETLAYHKVQPNEPWMCFTTLPDGGLVASAFRDSNANIEDVGRGDLHLV